MIPVLWNYTGYRVPLTVNIPMVRRMELPREHYLMEREKELLILTRQRQSAPHPHSSSANGPQVFIGVLTGEPKQSIARVIAQRQLKVWIHSRMAMIPFAVQQNLLVDFKTVMALCKCVSWG